MPTDGESATTLDPIDRFSVPDGPTGVGWIAEPEKAIQRASHAIARDGDVWVIDPVDAPGLDELLAALGTVVGVVVLLDRHKRDAATLARRHDVPVVLPEVMAGEADEFPAETEIFRGELGDSGFVGRTLVDNRFWREAILVDEESGTLVVPEAVGTNPFFCVPGERLGVNPLLRVRPPRSLGEYAPERVFVGHGAGVQERAGEALQQALRGARRKAPRLYWQSVRNALPV